MPPPPKPKCRSTDAAGAACAGTVTAPSVAPPRASAIAANRRIVGSFVKRDMVVSLESLFGCHVDAANLRDCCTQPELTRSLPFSCGLAQGHGVAAIESGARHRKRKGPSYDGPSRSRMVSRGLL